MNYAKCFTLTYAGFGLQSAMVEATVDKGFPSFQVCGVKKPRETSERLQSALRSIDLSLRTKKVLLHVEPGREDCSDLSLIAAILMASGEKSGMLQCLDPSKTIYAGNVSLNGVVTPLENSLLYFIEAKRKNFHSIVFPAASISSAPDIPGLTLYPVHHIHDLKKNLPSYNSSRSLIQEEKKESIPLLFPASMQRILCVIASGFHSVLFIGPPGTGKSTLARNIEYYLPPLSEEELLEILLIHHNLFERPVRSPHHSATVRSLIGGGYPVEMGEITRAHHGILLLEELSLFSRNALQSLREPFEEGKIHLTRKMDSVELPASFLFAATTNPCPCGNLYSEKTCTCSAIEKKTYQTKILGPLRDRIDMEIIVSGERNSKDYLEESEILCMLERANEARKERYRGTPFRFNGKVHMKFIDELIPAGIDVETLIHKISAHPRTAHSIRRLARTCADLDGARDIRAEHIHEAAFYRMSSFFKQI